MSLDKNGKPGASKRSHLRQLAKSKGEQVKFEDDDIDQAQAFYISVFASLFSAEHGIRYDDFYYYEQVTGIHLDSDERGMLQEIAAAVLRYNAEKRAADGGRQKSNNQNRGARRR